MPSRRRTPPHAALWLLLLSSGWLSLTGPACSTTPTIRYYQLAFVGDMPRAAADRAEERIVLGVDYLVPDAAYDDERMIFRESPYRLDYDYYHRWTSTPGVMLSDFLRRGYQRTGEFRAVVAGANPEADAILQGRVVAIEELDFAGSEDEWRVHVALDLSLRDAQTSQILWTRFVERVLSVGEERSREALARAYSELLERVVVETAPELAQATAQARERQRQRQQELLEGEVPAATPF